MTGLSKVAVLVVSVVLGYGIAVAMSSPVQPSPTPEPGDRDSSASTDGPAVASSTTQPGPSSTTTEQRPQLTTYLVWTSGGLTKELVAGLEAEFETVSVVAGDVAPLVAGDGRVFPLDGLAIDPISHRPFDPDGDLTDLRAGAVVVGMTSARYRGISVGDALTFDGRTYDVVGIADDAVVSAAEVVFSKSDDRTPIKADRYALVETELSRAVFEGRVREMHEGPTPLRIRAEGESRWLRHGDAVLPQIFIKLALGEFSYRAGDSSRLAQSRDFVVENIVTRDVPVLGSVTCHRLVLEMLAGAMSQLAEEGLGHLVDPGEYAGCWNPRFIRTVAGTPAGISRHSWGAALDINAVSNPLGSSGSQDPRLVEIMAEWGFIWGGDWGVPDAMHFEYGIQPDP